MVRSSNFELGEEWRCIGERIFCCEKWHGLKIWECMRERRGEGPGVVCLNAYGRVWVYMGGRVGMCGQGQWRARGPGHWKARGPSIPPMWYINFWRILIEKKDQEYTQEIASRPLYSIHRHWNCEALKCVYARSARIFWGIHVGIEFKSTFSP